MGCGQSGTSTAKWKEEKKENAWVPAARQEKKQCPNSISVPPFIFGFLTPISLYVCITYARPTSSRFRCVCCIPYREHTLWTAIHGSRYTTLPTQRYACDTFRKTRSSHGKSSLPRQFAAVTEICLGNVLARFGVPDKHNPRHPTIPRRMRAACVGLDERECSD